MHFARFRPFVWLEARRNPKALRALMVAMCSSLVNRSPPYTTFAVRKPEVIRHVRRVQVRVTHFLVRISSTTPSSFRLVLRAFSISDACTINPLFVVAGMTAIFLVLALFVAISIGAIDVSAPPPPCWPSPRLRIFLGNPTSVFVWSRTNHIYEKSDRDVWPLLPHDFVLN